MHCFNHFGQRKIRASNLAPQRGDSGSPRLRSIDSTGAITVHLTVLGRKRHVLINDQQQITNARSDPLR